MQAVNRILILYLLVMGIVIVPSCTNAAKIVELYMEPSSPIWMNYDQNAVEIAFHLNCSLNESSNSSSIFGVVTLPDGKEAPLNFGEDESGMYEAHYTATFYGNYEATVTCEDSSGKDTETLSFVVKKPTIEIVEPATGSLYDVYAGSSFTVKLKFKINNQYVDTGLAPEFSVSIKEGNTKIPLNVDSIIFDPGTKIWSIQVVSFNQNTPPGIYDLEVRGSLTMDGSKRTAIDVAYDAVRINDALVAVLIDPNPSTEIRLADTTNKNITIQVLEKGVPANDLTVDNFEAYIEGNGIDKRIPILNVWYDANTQRYKLLVQIPKLESSNEPYELYIKVVYDGYTPAVSSKVPVYFVIPVSGQLIDPAGNVVNGIIKIRGENTEEILMRTDNLGRYQTSLPSGTYDFEIRFPEVTAVIKQVEINEPVVNGIRYDRFIKNIQIEGFKAVKLVVLEFAPLFKTAYLTIPYNDASVRNEKGLEVYRCTDWNFGRRECVGEWEAVSSEVNIVSNVVKVNTTKLGAFVVGEREPLIIELDEVQKDYYAGENVEVSGVVKNSKGDPVKDVRITVSIKGMEATTTTTTDLGGKFSAVISAPQEDGSYEIVTKAEKNPYISIEKTFVIHVERKIELKSIAPDVVSVVPGQSKVVEITLQNTGQVDVTNIVVDVTNLNYDWFAIVPKSINVIKAGESKVIKMYINIPAEDCINDRCEKYYFPKITFSGKEAKDTVSFTLKLEEEVEETNSSAQQQAESADEGWSFDLPEIDSISGYFALEGAEKTNFYLSIFFVFMIFLAASVKKRKKLKLRSRVLPFGKRRF